MSGSAEEVVLYKTEDGRDQIQLRAVEGTVWLTQAEMAALFDMTIQNVSPHLRNILRDGELKLDAALKESLITASDGKNYKTAVYNLEMILAVGYQGADEDIAELLRGAAAMKSERQQ